MSHGRATHLLWCPECGYRKIVRGFDREVRSVAAGRYPHRNPAGGNCKTKLNRLVLKGEDLEYRISR